MKIYGTDDAELLDAIITEAAEHEEELMKSDFIKLSWSSDTKITLPVGSYIIPFPDGLKYRLLEPYHPTQVSEAEFKYEPLFQHPKMWLGKVIFVFDTTDTTGKAIRQQVWDYNGLTATLLQYVVDAINNAFAFTDADKFNFTIIGEVDSTVSLSFSNSDILSAISSIASACKKQCEWHLDWEQKSLYFGQLAYDRGEDTTPVLKIGENVGKASVSNSNDGYYNVFRPQGSTRNMSVQAASGENVSTGVRLGLNEAEYPNGYIDTRLDPKEPIQELGLTFDDIYPHVDLYAYNVRKRTLYLLKDNGEKVVDHYDGETPVYRIYTVWYIRLAYPTYDTNGNVTGWTDYTLDVKNQVLDGYKPMVTFKANTSEGALSSSLAGQPTSGEGFEVEYQEMSQSISASEVTGDSGVEVLAGDYKIVFVKQGENDMIIPTNEETGLIPRGELTPSLKGNIVVLYNIVMGQGEIAAAQNDLKEAALKEIARRNSDLNNYSVPSYPHVFEQSNPNLYIGRKVTYDDGQGYQLTTRVIKLVTKVDYNFVQMITVGNQQIKGSISQLKEDVKTIMSGNFQGAGLNQTQVKNIIQNYVDQRFLRKDVPDTASKLITFLEGVALKDGKGIDSLGNAILKQAILDVLKSPDFSSGIGGSGFGLSKDANGKTSLEIDKLLVRLKMIISELELRKLSYVGGDEVYSSAGSHVVKVKKLPNGNFRCYVLADDGTTRTMNNWRIGDQAQCRTNNIQAGIYENVSNRYYWRLVVARGTETLEDNKLYNYVDLSNTLGSLDVVGEDGKTYSCVGYDTTVENDIPKEEDDIVQLGNQIDSERQYAYIIYVSEHKRVDYAGINDFDLASHEVELHSATGGFVNSDRFEIRSSSGTGVSSHIVCERGQWYIGMICGHYDHVSNNNATWLCNVGKGMTTTEEPKDGSVVWIKETYGVKGESTRYINVTSERGNIMLNAQGSVTLTATVIDGGEDVTSTITPNFFTWTRDSGSPASDATWNLTHVGVGNVITVTADEVFRKANFTCMVSE